MGRFDPDEFISERNKSPREQFHDERLDRDSLTKTQWPAQIDRAAFDVIYGIAIGKTSSTTDIGGTIDSFEFPRATGQFYVDGLRNLSGEESNLSRTLSRYDSKAVGKLGFHLNKFRHELRAIGGEEMDIDRAVEALVEKAAVEALEQSARVDGNDGAGLRQLRGSNSASDLILKLFSDPRVEAYADSLIDIVTNTSPTKDGLLARLDEPKMTTPLWQHQQEAIRNWFENDQLGYVDMATATGKTVLGLTAIAARYGNLHPVDNHILHDNMEKSNDPRILIVAGNEVLLSQWREEVDNHLDIPPMRTVPINADEGMNIELRWGTIEFRTAQSLLQTASFREYDLVILDEAHRYSRSREGRGWGDLLDDLVSHSDAVLAMSGSVDGGWQGDSAAKESLEENLEQCYRFPLPQARARGVIADFSWDIHYAATTAEDEEKLSEQTRVTSAAYDSLTGNVDRDALGVPADAMEESYESYAKLRSFVQSNDGSELRKRSDEFDRFATALFTRQPVRWNLSPADDAIIDLVTRHESEQKTVVLVQNYEDATRLGERLINDEGFNKDQTIVLENSNDDRSAKIQEFKNVESGIIVGPSDLLGVGVNMPDAEVAVNIARGGVNASLVQRIGRILRNPRGDKEAQFYHVVPQPTGTDAIDEHEDGQQLLRQAAAFHTLGQTFKEVPSFSVSTNAVCETVSNLERAGEKALDRRSDDHVSALVETDAGADALRELRGAIQSATNDNAASDDHTPVIVEYWSQTDDSNGQSDEPDTGTEEQDGSDERLFTERNDLYEQYRLYLDQYRAAKGVAEHLLEGDFDVIRQDSEHVIDPPPEYEDTSFHEQFERALNEYMTVKRRVNGENGEPGSLPIYRELWPSPRKEDGAMIQEEVAERIGTDYAQADPLFFPRENDEGLYELPLPDGRVLAVDGIRERENDDTSGGRDETNSAVVHLSTTLVAAAKLHIERENIDTAFSKQIELWSRELLIDVLQGDMPAFASDVEVGKETVAVELSDDVLSFVRAGCESDNSPFQNPNMLVETAVWSALDLEPTKNESVTTNLPTELVYATQAHDIDLESVFEDALRAALRKHI